MADVDILPRSGDIRATQLYYTRCPVPTATGIALETGILDRLFEGTRYALADVAGQGAAGVNAHYTHSIDRCFREGGGSPPIWARSRGADTKVVGITFMEETLGIFVRAADSADSVAGLSGRRIGLPLHPGLVFNFWRFAAEKGFHSALARHGLPDGAVAVVDVPERAIAVGAPGSRPCRYTGQLQALLDGRIDAMFAKGPELALLEREARGRVRMLYDVASSGHVADRVNNSTPRLVTAGARMVVEEREVVVRYLQGLIRAAAWARTHASDTRAIVASECAVAPEAIDRYLCADYPTRLEPAIDAGLVASVAVQKSFLADRGYLAGDFALDDWIDPGPLAEAHARETGGDA
jgi:sulfonate transport system substrate-binding protein